MRNMRFWHKPKVMCVGCGFLGFRKGGYEPGDIPYLSDTFRQCHDDDRRSLRQENAYKISSDDGNEWDVVGCFHHVWLLWGTGSKEENQAKTILNECRLCPYFYPYRSGYEPSAHNELWRDGKNQRIVLAVGLINAAAVLLGVIVNVIFRG